MTYEQLKQIIKAMDYKDQQKEATVLLIDAGEFTNIHSFQISNKWDSLEIGTYYLTV